MGSIEFVLSLVKDRGMVHQETLFDLARTEFPGSIAYEAMVKLEEYNKVLVVDDFYVFLEDLETVSLSLASEEFITSVMNGVRGVESRASKLYTLYFISEVEEAIKNLELVEVEYALPNRGYRTKSIYFPKGTKVTVK